MKEATFIAENTAETGKHSLMSLSIGKYRLNRLIGKGGMAEVYEAEMTGPAGFKKVVCLKKIRKEYSAYPDFVKMFKIEARLAATMQHPNVVQVFDFDEQDGLLYLTMEYVEGTNLKSLTQKMEQLGFQATPGFAVFVLQSLLAALDHAHTRSVDGRLTPIIHRDVSPHNILLSTDGLIKLADFGIAKAKGSTGATRTGIIRGKLTYMSPEQARGGEISPSSDLFNAGIVFWELLTGRRFIRQGPSQDMVAQLMAFKDASIPHLSVKLNDYLNRILAPNVAKRFQSAKEAQQALKDIGVSACDQEEAACIARNLIDEQEPQPLSVVLEHNKMPASKSVEQMPTSLRTKSSQDISQSTSKSEAQLQVSQSSHLETSVRPIRKIAIVTIVLASLLLLFVIILIVDRFTREPESNTLPRQVVVPAHQTILPDSPILNETKPIQYLGVESNSDQKIDDSQTLAEKPPRKATPSIESSPWTNQETKTESLRPPQKKRAKIHKSSPKPDGKPAQAQNAAENPFGARREFEMPQNSKTPR